MWSHKRRKTNPKLSEINKKLSELAQKTTKTAGNDRKQVLTTMVQLWNTIRGDQKIWSMSYAPLAYDILRQQDLIIPEVTNEKKLGYETEHWTNNVRSGKVPIIKKNEERGESTSTEGWTLPTTKFIGPGNDIESEAKPTSTTDAIAQIHDMDYAHAQKQKDIELADDLMIDETNTVFLKSLLRGDLKEGMQAMAGNVGIRLKRKAEAISDQYMA